MIPPLPGNPSPGRVVVIGGGPAGLMAAEAAVLAGAQVDLFDRMGSVGRKVLIAGKGGLNLTHSEDPATFLQRYAPHQAQIEPWLREFDASSLRQWARELGVETMIGSSGRVFPRDLKAAPLLRSWVRRLREQGVRFHMNCRWQGWDAAIRPRFESDAGLQTVPAEAQVLALGGASWPVLGSDGRWLEHLDAQGIRCSPLTPANVGYRCQWSDHFRQRFAGEPVKPVRLRVGLSDGSFIERQGEFVITDYGVEGSLIYALGAALRSHASAADAAQVELDLLPDLSLEQAVQKLSRDRGKRSLSEHLRRSLALHGVRAGLLRECIGAQLPTEPERLAAALKGMPLRLLGPQPIEEAISSAGGLCFSELDPQLMLRQRPGVFAAGEMIDWEAPTGGYLLTACFASGLIAGRAAAAWARQTAQAQSLAANPP